MIDLDEWIDETKKKIDVLPNINKESIKLLMQKLSYLEKSEQSKIIDDINLLVDSKYHEHVLKSKNPVLSFPKEEESKGDFEIGTVCAGDTELYTFALTTENLRENIFVTARSGHGKTSLIFYFVGKLVYNNISFIFFDWKNDYRSLSTMYPEILVIRFSDLEFNPLTNVPEGMDIKVWWRIVLDILSHSQGLLMATPSYILQIIEELYDEKKGEITFRDLGNYLKSQREESRKKGEYADVAENRIFNINQALDKVINVRHGFDVKDLFNKRVIIEMSPLDFAIASFLIQTLIMHEFYRRLTNNVRLNRKSTLQDLKELFSLVVLDEAHLTQYSGQERSLVSSELSPPPLTKFFSQSRELLMGTLAATQFPHLVMDAFKDNAGTKLIGNLTESNQQRDMASSIGLDRDDEKILGRLEKGIWVCTVAGRTKPFVLKTPNVSKGNMIAEAEMIQRSNEMLTEFRMRKQEIESRMFLNKVEKNLDRVNVPELTKEAWLVLDYVLEHPFNYQGKITKGIGVSGRKTVESRALLIQKGLIKLDKFGVITYPRIHYILTNKALELLKTLGKEPKKIGFWKYINNGVPSYWHRLFQFYVRSQHEGLGWTGKIEYTLPDGRRADIYEERGGYKKVIELEDSTKDLENKLKVLEDDLADELVLLYKDETQSRYARAKLMEMKIPEKKVLWVGLARDYAKLLNKIIYRTIIAPEKNGNKQKSDDSVTEKNNERKLRGNKEERK